MTTVETVLLPKLNDHWVPKDSRLCKKIALKNNNDHVARINGFLKQSTDLQSPRKGGVFNKENSSFEIIKSLDRSKVTDQPRLNNAVHGKNRTMKHVDVKNSRNNNNRTRLKDVRDLPDTKLCLNTYDKLTVCGVAFGSKDIQPTTSQQQQQQHQQKLKQNKPTTAKEIMPPLLNSFHSENTQQQFHYRKSLLSNPNSRKPTQTASASLTGRSSNSLQSQSTDDMIKPITMKEYLQHENARYVTNEQIVKRTLFDNWLRNIKVNSSQDYFIHHTDDVTSSSSGCG